MIGPVERVKLKAAAYERARKLGIPIPTGVHIYTRRNGHIVGIPFVGSPMRELIRRLQQHAGLPVSGEFDLTTQRWLGFDQPPPDHVSGVDLSNHQPRVNYAQVKASGVAFAWLKASEGATYRDPYYAQHRAGFAKVGVQTGAYHFARPASASGDTQARRFLEAAQPRRGDVLPVLDLEVADGLAAGALTEWVRAFLGIVTPRCGSCVVYTYPAFWRSNMADTKLFASQPLWIAHYGVARPDIPGGWTHYSAWQFTSTGQVPGIPGNADRSATGVPLAALRIQ